ncbi:chemotaxis protein CheW [Cryobacterium sinapicolor]|uniref:Chemotaxis protein CheW n=1 Tax=Cryobacterium sinapicolor TaxID=1259236 RepID=A0ABY2ITM7_9MICO|nr:MULTISPECIES: chemotaxis protein CheW [Cryobacterium]TFC93181.1 chemotaxis protein CheW [Cryobacterium sp. TMT3-29-2]TFC94292.1 chemotaxis protein CheW [Cryobacterium sinapicolor]
MTSVHAVLLPVGPDLFAVPIDRVREVVAAPPLTRLVTAPRLVLGLFNLRGQIVPLLDTAALLGLPVIDAVAFAVVLQTRHGLLGLAVTGFPRRAMLDGLIGPSELVGTAGTFRVGERVAVLLDPDTLLAAERFGRAPSSEIVAPSRVDA